MSSAATTPKPDLSGYVSCNPAILGGKPCIAGRRVRVQDIYAMHELEHLSASEIAQSYDITHAQVYAALAYAWERRDEILALLKRDQEFYEELQRKGPSLTEKALARLRGQEHQIPPR